MCKINRIMWSVLVAILFIGVTVDKNYASAVIQSPVSAEQVIPNKLMLTLNKSYTTKKLFGENSSKITKISVTNKYKKYFTVSKKKIICKKYCSSAKLSVTINGKVYKITLKIKLPKPKAVIRVKKSPSNKNLRRILFKYNNVTGATKMRVRIVGNSKSSVNKVLDKYLSNPKKKKYITSSKKHGTYKFKIWAFYGKKKSEAATYTVKW